MQQITSARPQPDTRIHGCYEITAQITVDGGYSINTQTATGGTRIPELCIATADRDTYRLAYAVIREGGLNNVHPDGVRAALTDALVRDLAEVQRRRDTPSKNRVEHINALLDRLESPVERAELDALAADINRTLGRSLAETVPAGSKPQVARSRTGVEHKPLSPAMQRAVNAQINGIIYPRDGVRAATLQALARRGLGKVHFDGRRKRIVSLELNAVSTAAPATQIAVHDGSRALVANTRAAGRYADDITWQPIAQVEDDDTHVIATISGEAQAVDKTHSVVIRAGEGPAVEVNAVELLNMAVA